MKNYLIIFVLVIALFAAIVLFTGFLGNHFGKTAETGALVVIAGVLIAMLIQSKRS